MVKRAFNVDMDDILDMLQGKQSATIDFVRAASWETLDDVKVPTKIVQALREIFDAGEENSKYTALPARALEKLKRNDLISQWVLETAVPSFT